MIYDVAERLARDIKKHGSMQAAIAAAEEEYFRGKTVSIFHNGKTIQVKWEDLDENGNLKEESRKRLKDANET